VRNYFLAAETLWLREIVRFVRQRNRIVGALGTPLLFWLIIGSGLGRSFQAGGSGGGYLEYFFPGTLALIVLFTAIFSTISIIEDRQVGFLQSVLVAPVPRSAVTLGKIMGATTLAVLQALMFLALAPIAGISLDLQKFFGLAGVLTMMGFSLSALGYLIAWRMESTQGFHAIMNLLLIPLWLLSGALFPPSGAPGWIRGIIRANPLTYGIAAVRQILFWGNRMESGLPSLAASLAVSALFCVAAFIATTLVAGKR